MKAIGGLLRGGRPGERGEFAAAFVVGATNEALKAVARTSTKDAQAMSYSRGRVVIGVSHGAVAGALAQLAPEIIKYANKKILAAGGSETTITSIATRPQLPQSP